MQPQCSNIMPPAGPLVLSILLLLFVTSSTGTTFSDARRLPLRRLVMNDDSVKAGQHQQEPAAEITGGGERRRSMIGSRPPRCERVCMSCGPCEAVQVPVVPQERHNNPRRARARAHRQEQQQQLFSYRVNGITNYKPLSWKCRCGGAILDP